LAGREAVLDDELLVDGHRVPPAEQRFAHHFFVSRAPTLDGRRQDEGHLKAEGVGIRAQGRSVRSRPANEMNADILVAAKPYGMSD
jgi:hypothetical protein